MRLLSSLGLRPFFLEGCGGRAGYGSSFFSAVSSDGNREDAAEDKSLEPRTESESHSRLNAEKKSHFPRIWNRGIQEEVSLPRSYDYRKVGRAPQIGNQGSLGTCWAFASLTALESSLLQNERVAFPWIICPCTIDFSLGQDEGRRVYHVHGLVFWAGRGRCGSRRILMATVFPPVA